MMSRFTVFLPSNISMELYPQNMVSKFTTKLSDVLELHGNWEVGLVAISFPSKVHNISGSRFSYTLHRLHTRLLYSLREHSQLRRWFWNRWTMHIRKQRMRPQRSLPFKFRVTCTSWCDSPSTRMQKGSMQYPSVWIWQCCSGFEHAPNMRWTTRTMCCTQFGSILNCVDGSGTDERCI